MKTKKHRWQPPAWLKEPVASTARFHDKEVEVMKGFVTLTTFGFGTEITGRF